MKKIFVLFLITMMAFGAVAQTDSVPLPKSLRSNQSNTANAENSNYAKRKIHFITGGNFGVNFGLPTYIGFQFQPKFGIVPLDWLTIAVNGTYMLNWYINDNKCYHTFGVNPYIEAAIFKKQLILHASYEYLNYPYLTYNYENGYLKNITEERVSSHCILVGAGYRMNFSVHSSLSFTVLLPVYQYNSRGSSTYNYYSCWYQPIVRIGYNYSF